MVNLCAAFGPRKRGLGDDCSHKDYCHAWYILSEGGGFPRLVLVKTGWHLSAGSTSEETPSTRLKLRSFNANRDDLKLFLLLDFINYKSK